MDQPTNLEITIKGKKEEVKRAALAAQRSIDFNTNGFEEEAYEYGDGLDFESKIDDAIGMLGDYNYNESSDGTADYNTEQESYSPKRCLKATISIRMYNNLKGNRLYWPVSFFLFSQLVYGII